MKNKMLYKEYIAKYLGYLILLSSIYSLFGGVVAWLMPPFAKIISRFLFLFALPSEFSPINAFLLFILASAIRHRIKIALWIEVIYFQIGYVFLSGLFLIFYFSGLVTSRDLADTAFTISGLFWIIFALIVSLIAAILLIWSQKAFPTKIVNGEARKAIIVAIGGFVLATIGGLITSLLTYHGNVSLWARLLFVLKEIVSDFRYTLPFGSKFITYHSGNNIWVSFVITAFMLSGFLLSFYLFTRSAQKELVKSPDDALKVRKLILEFGADDSLAYFATRRDKSAVFSKNKKAVITCRLIGSVLLASGDPIGQKNAWRNAGENFINLARQHGWTPAVVGASEEGGYFYSNLGLSSIAFGDEAVVLTKDFSTQNKGMHDVAQVMRRATRENYSVKIRRQFDIDAEELAYLSTLSDKWRDGEERGFSMATSRFGDPTDQQMLIVTAYDENQEPMGLLSFVPTGGNKISLDTMRRNSKAMNGVVTFMITSIIEYGKNMGIDEVSLNFAAARHFFVKGESIDSGFIDKNKRRLMLFLSRWYQLESLYRSNDIYLPEWRPRYICYGEATSLLAVLFAIGRAEGFVSENIFSKITTTFREYRFSDNNWWAKQSFIDQVHKAEKEFMIKNAPKPSYDETKLEKLHNLKKLGIPPYSQIYRKTLTISTLVEKFENQEEFDSSEFTLIGRLTGIRGRGAMNFADLQDGDASIQIILKRDTIDEYAEDETFEVWKKYVTPGDIIAVKGTLMRTQTGALSLKVLKWNMISKSLTLFTEEEKIIRDELRAQQNLIKKVREKLVVAKFVEAKENPLSFLYVGFERIFAIEDNFVKLYLAYSNAPESLKEISSIFNQNINLKIKEVVPDAIDEIEEEDTRIAFEKGLPPFVSAEITLDALLAESGEKNER